MPTLSQLRLMAGGMPPYPGGGGGGGGSRLIDLIMSRGQQEADFARQRGDIFANALTNAGQQIAQGFQQHNEQKAIKKRDAAYLAIMQDPKSLEDPKYAYQKFLQVGGPEDGAKMFQGFAGGLQLLQEKRNPEADQKAAVSAIEALRRMDPSARAVAWQPLGPAARKVFGEQVPEQYDDTFFEQVLVPFADSTKPEPKREKVTTRRQDGTEVTQFVDPNAPGVYESAPEPPKPPNMQTMETAEGIRTFNPQTGEVGPVIARGKPPAPRAAEPLEAVMGPDGNPILLPRSQAAGKRPASSREQGRPVVSGDANRVAELDTSLDDLKVLSGQITGATGVSAKVGAALPNVVTEMTGIGSEAKSKQATIDRVKQVIGKALEGGVLRKEDETKYEKILPTIGDPPAVVASKLRGLEQAIRQRRERLLDSLGDAGYDTTRYRGRTGPGGPAPLTTSDEALLKKYGY